MTPTLARCPHPHSWPAVECLGGLEPLPPVRRTPAGNLVAPIPAPRSDTAGLVLSDGDSDQIAHLAEAAVVAAFAVAGGIVALAYGVLRGMLGGQR